MGMFPLIGQPALKDLLGPQTSDAAISQWFGVIIATFLVGAASGGVLFGWLGDKMGRVRAMGLSIFTYAIFTGLCGFAHHAEQITALRFIASLGMGGEWSLGVALVNEVWSAKSRAVTAGLIGAAANVGYLIVGFLSMALLGFITSAQHGLSAIGLSQATVHYLTDHSAWRLLMISGALPALLNFLILLFVPESEKWKAEHARGATAHWARLDLLGVLYGSVAALVIIWAWSPMGADKVNIYGAIAITVVGLGVALIGYLHPVRKYMHRAEAAGTLQSGRGAVLIKLMLFGAVLSSVALLGTWGSTQWAPKWVADQLAPHTKNAKEWTQIWLSIGACVGTMIAAIAAGRYGRRITYAVLCATSIAGTLLLYLANDTYGPFFLFCIFLAGTVTASFYGFFPLYLPELLPTAVRATGQGFAYNFGRIIAAVGGLQTANLMKLFGGSFPKAASCMAGIYIIGIVIVWFGPETKGQPLPE
ncbi:sugar transport protein [Chthoniobacter flavus]|nr:sugar transport protein [Chthoniobacter flavus]